jgi:hypothetical protein
MGKKRRAKMRQFDFEAIDAADDFEDLVDDIYSSGWDDAWDNDQGHKGRDRLAKRDRFADEFMPDPNEWDDEYKIGDWYDDYRSNDW